MGGGLGMYKLGMSYFNRGVYWKGLWGLGEGRGGEDGVGENG